MSRRSRAGPKQPAASWRVPARVGPAAVFAVAFVLRAIYLLEMQDEDLFRVLLGDARSYDAWGTGIAAGDWLGKEVFYQAPLYPYFLGVVYSLFGHSLAAARWVQILLGSLSCVFLCLAGRRLLSPAAGLVAGLGLAVYPPAIFYDGLIQKSVFDLFFLTALLALLAALAPQRQGPRRWIAAGALLGLLALTRENALVLVALVLLWGCLISPPRPRLLPGLFLAAGVAAVLLPVVWRNLAVGGELHLTTSQLGPNLYIGNHPGADGIYAPLRPGRGDALYERRDATELAELALGHRLTPGEVSRYWADRAVSFMTGQPLDWLRLMGRKCMLLVNRVEIADTEAQEVYAERSRVLRLLTPVLHFGLLVPLAAFGIALSRERRGRLALPLLLLLGYASSIVVFYILGRYRHPLTPLLLLFAAAGLVEAFGVARRREWRAALPAAAVLVVALVLANWPLVDPERNKAATYINLGRAMAESGRVETSLAYYHRALAIDPRNFVVLNKLANQLSRIGREQEALALLRQALAIEPDHSDSHNNIANLLVRLGQPQEAMDHYRTATRLNPTYPEAWANLGLMLVNQGRIDEGIDCYRRAIAADPSLEGAASNLRILLDMKARDESLPPR